MLQIDSDQMVALDSHCRTIANRELGRYARERFPDPLADWSTDRLAALAERVRTIAQELGYEREDQVACILDLAVMFGSDFSRQQWAAPIFADKRCSNERKIELLHRRLRDAGVDLQRDR